MRIDGDRHWLSDLLKLGRSMGQLATVGRWIRRKKVGLATAASPSCASAAAGGAADGLPPSHRRPIYEWTLENENWSDSITVMAYLSHVGRPTRSCAIISNTLHPEMFAELQLLLWWSTCYSVNSLPSFQTSCAPSNYHHLFVLLFLLEWVPRVLFF